MPTIDPIAAEVNRNKLEAQRQAAEEKKKIEDRSLADYLRFEASYMSEQKKASLKKVEIAKREADQMLALNEKQFAAGLKNLTEYGKAKRALSSKSADLLRQENSIIDPSALTKLKGVADKAGSYISSVFSGFGLNISSIAGPAGLALLVQQFIKINTQLREADRTIRQISGISGSPYLQSAGKGEERTVGREATSLYPDIARMSMRYQLREKDLLQESFQMAFKGRFKEEEVEGKEANEKDIISRLMEETIGLGQVSGLGRGAMQDYYQQMHVGLGVETNKLKIEFKELYDIASQLDGPLNNFIANSIKMSQQMILYGFELDSAKVFTKLFSDELDQGKASLTGLVNMLTGIEEKPGQLAFMAQQLTAEQWKAITGDTSIGVGSDIFAQIETLRNVQDKGIGLRYEAFFNAAQDTITQMTGISRDDQDKEKVATRAFFEKEFLASLNLLSSSHREAKEQLSNLSEIAKSGGMAKVQKEIAEKRVTETEATLFSQQGENAFIATMSWMKAAYDVTSGGMRVVLVGGKAAIMQSLFGKGVETYRKDPGTRHAMQEFEKGLASVSKDLKEEKITPFQAQKEIQVLRDKAAKNLSIAQYAVKPMTELAMQESDINKLLYTRFERALTYITKKIGLSAFGTTEGALSNYSYSTFMRSKFGLDASGIDFFTGPKKPEKKHKEGLIGGKYLGEEVPILAQAGKEVLSINDVRQKRSERLKPQLDLSVNLPTTDLNSFSQKQDKNLYINVGPFSFDSNQQENTSALIEDAMEEATKRVKEEYYQARKFK